MRELDVLLRAYLDERYANAGACEQAAFEALLALEDPELMDVLLGAPPGDGAPGDVVAAVLAADRHR